MNKSWSMKKRGMHSNEKILHKCQKFPPKKYFLKLSILASNIMRI